MYYIYINLDSTTNIILSKILYITYIKYKEVKDLHNSTSRDIII